MLDTDFIRSQIDTTAVQALIDTRNEVERWTNAHVEVIIIAHSGFHTTHRTSFSSILPRFFRRG